MKYRSEIDGLRAVAVLPVIFFHAGFTWFSGGYIGVDVFFVISGYLITSIIINEFENGTFSFVKFYERRARRILPALFFVMLFCISVAFILMIPQQFEYFSKSLVSIAFFGSNIFFWRTSGYFSADSEENPLLHTWSLAVEEQFYIIFPILLYILWRFGKKPTFYIIIAFLLASLILSEWGWRNSPSANFYLLPTRAWELFFGSIAAFIIYKRGVQSNEFLSWVGLFAIVAAIFLYDESTPFPSFYTLLPVTGAFLIILYCGNSTFSSKILSFKLFVAIGLISYSAYLWHQPLFAFARIGSLDTPSDSKMLLFALASLVCAFFSWKFIEQPFRADDKIYNSKKAILFISTTGVAFIAAIGCYGLITNGAASIRFTDAQISYLSSAEHSPLRSDCHFPQTEESLNREICEYFTKNASVAVLGNSHAVELSYELAKILEPLNLSIKQYSMSACPHNFIVLGEEESICYRWHSNVIKEVVEDKGIETVVLSYANLGKLNGKYRESLVDMTQYLLDSNKKVILLMQAPLAGLHIDKYLSSNVGALKQNVKGLSLTEWKAMYSGKEILIEELPKEVIILDPVNYFCQSDDCFVIKNGKALYFDDDHMSLNGASLLTQALLHKAFK